jgi:propanediol dehydratase large subunit
MKRGITGLDVVKVLAKRGFDDVARNILGMLKLRISGDYLQTAAWVDADFRVWSAVNDPNDYHGPGTGYRLSEERWKLLKELPQAKRPELIGE